MVFRLILFCVFSGVHPEVVLLHETQQQKNLFGVKISIFIDVDSFSSPSSRWQGWRGEFEERPEWHARIEQEAAKGENGLHGSPTANPREDVRATKVPQRAGPNGAGQQARIKWHAGQDVVPEPKVNIDFLIERPIGQ